MSVRQRLVVRGIVQGVGFRPFVYRLAGRHALSGWARNDGHGVTLEVQGSMAAVSAFVSALRKEAPALAQIAQVQMHSIDIVANETGFEIVESQGDGQHANIGADACTCEACLAELCNPGNRRYRYPFINCTDCGPRYTIVNGLPYDRVKTSMAAFTQCPTCLAEYSDPKHRRFHAEPNACPQCGPQLRLLDAHGNSEAGDVIAATLRRLQAGEIVAIKGLGGFHLVCDARNAQAVARLRERKQRPVKPFAVMLANAESLAELAQLDAPSIAALQGVERPVVLLPKLAAQTDTQLPGIAPNMAWLGVMLPYTPLHYLLFHEAAGRPEGAQWMHQSQALALVMTSANRRGEPLIIDNEEALKGLAGIADAWLLHDRAIVTRCDDSVLRMMGNEPCFVRRSRGYAPRPLHMGSAQKKPQPSVLALGGFFKNTLCITRGNEAFLSQYIGDTDRAANCLALESAVTHLMQLTGSQPQAVAHDLHPDFFSTRLAAELAQRWQIPAFAVQHHHAHIASVLAEHHIDEPVLGLALDGVGMGDDGSAWGGELLRVDGARCERLSHLPKLPLPGADQAARQPWRMAAAVLAQLGRANEIATRFSAEQPQSGMLAKLLQQPAKSWPETTSMGRWFDAVAGLLGVTHRNDFEGHAAMLLESLAVSYGSLPTVPDAYRLQEIDGAWHFDFMPLMDKLSETRDKSYGAALWHGVLIDALTEWTVRTAHQHSLRTIACSGGCFVNSLLRQGIENALQAQGFRVLFNREAPPGDGGLALGQAWVAQRLLLAQSSSTG